MSTRNAYVYENTARKSTAPARKAAPGPVLLPSANRKTVQRSPKYVIMIIMTAMIIASTAMIYVSEQASVINLRKEKGQLVSQYEDIKLSNDLYYEDIMSKVDIKEIERVAVEELGMKMAAQGQIYTYANDVDDYVKQYVSIPN